MYNEGYHYIPAKGGVYLDTQLSKALWATEKIQEYDNNIKFILSQKIILAHILAGTAKELLIHILRFVEVIQ